MLWYRGLMMLVIISGHVLGDTIDLPSSFIGNANCFRVPSQMQGMPVGAGNFDSMNIISEKPIRPMHSAERTEHASHTYSTNQNSGKNPMVLLNELAMFNKIAHKYHLLNKEGPDHAPKFTVTLKLVKGDLVMEEYTGRGRKLKEAQHDAAATALSQTLFPHPPSVAKKGPKKTNYEVLNDKNACPISSINTLSQRSNIPVTYTVISESGPPHDKTFRMTCEFNGLRSEGVGTSKKKSRREAAYAMLQLLERNSNVDELPRQPKKKKRKNNKNRRSTVIRGPSSESIQSKFTSWSNAGSRNSILDNVMSSIGMNDYNSYSNDFLDSGEMPKITYPKSSYGSSSNIDSSSEYNQLDKLAKNSNYDVKYSQLDGKEGKKFSVLELKSTSTKNADVICFGEDPSIEKARELSTTEALRYLTQGEDRTMNVTSTSTLGVWKRNINSFISALKSSINSVSSKIPKEVLTRYSKYAMEFREL